MDRLAALKEILAQNPDDTFARYGLAMEYARAGQVESALAEYKRLLADNPEHVAAYQMAGQMLATTGRVDEARVYLEKGMAAAQRAGNQHARSQMEMLLEEISR